MSVTKTLHEPMVFRHLRDVVLVAMYGISTACVSVAGVRGFEQKNDMRTVLSVNVRLVTPRLFTVSFTQKHAIKYFNKRCVFVHRIGSCCVMT